MKREYHSSTSIYYGKREIYHIFFILSSDSSFFKERKEELKRSLVEKESELYLHEKQFVDNQQQALDQQLKNIEHYYIQRINNLEQQFSHKKKTVIQLREQELLDIEEHELRSCYELLRKQTKSFYSLFRTMLAQQSEREIQQLDEQIRYERNTLEAHLADDRREWPKAWKKIQKARYKQFRQQLIMNNTNPEEEKDLLRKVPALILFLLSH